MRILNGYVAAESAKLAVASEIRSRSSERDFGIGGWYT
jgi:hypothetical protein